MKKKKKNRVIKGRDYRENRHTDGLRKSKPVGYRFKGEHDYAKPTEKEIQDFHDGKRNDIYYENRLERSDKKSSAKRGMRFDEGGKIISDNWGNDGSTPSNNKDYNDLYAMFPDSHKEARDIWNQLSEKQKKDFLYDLDVTDAASEHISDSWLEFVNAKSEKDWLDNATNWDEMKTGGVVGEWRKGTTIKFKTKKEATNRFNLMKTSDEYRNLKIEKYGDGDDKLIDGYIIVFEYIKKDNKHAKGGGMDDYTKNLGMVDVIFKNPKYNYSTNVSGSISEEEAKKYFVGKTFDVGIYPKENMQTVIDAKFQAKGTYAKGGSMKETNFTGYLGEEISISTIETGLGRKLHWWDDDIVKLDGVKYKKCFMRPFYKKI